LAWICPTEKVSAAETAVIVTVNGAALTLAGAAYTAASEPVETIVPMVELPPGMPFTCQSLTAILLVPVTVAVNVSVPLTGMDTGLETPDGGERVTTIGGIVATAEPDTPESASDTALIVAGNGFDGATAGAV
jgi:hypothetical protein